MFFSFRTDRQKTLTGGGITFLRRLLRVRKPHKGGILIEFTFSIPVCISLLFFVNDHYRIYELNNKIKSSTYLAASMIQHVTNTRTDKQLAIVDIRNISVASCLNLFHTNSMFKPWPFGISYIAHFYYVKRLSSDSYQYQKTVGGTCSGRWSRPTGQGGAVGGSNIGDMVTHLYATTTLSQAQVKSMHPDLIC